MQQRKLLHRRTSPVIWFIAIICTIVAIAVIVTGLVVFIGYLIIRPRVPSISVTQAHMEKLGYHETGQMDTQISITIKAENDNAKAHATFSDLSLFLSFNGIKIAQLTAGPFDVPKNSSLDLPYFVQSSSIPLAPEGMEEVDASLKRNKISFDLKGDVRARWRVGVLGSVKFWGHMACQLHFFPSNGSSLNPPHCSSRSQ
ncbi:PREDICTED: NDR1/HIN1-like protein 12 [Nelumbo nucifera]|uniref:NDR1/HIN1-like protein 12 n=2 Tax=Nelumbo nucifera TaxID=4432 RepID=A0A1U8AFR0_NELNU|nr:PREDICTED: NDR1/HIN1-like protein 12 [Nelumbo nucifera]DAD36361.1 TPA_asm: hypothetical protein HUJ06_007002 [Nelumbo nucifera]